MSRLTSLSLEESVLQSQAAVLRDLFQRKTDKSAKIIALAGFPRIYLQIWQAASVENDTGISAKLIGERIHLSRWSVLEYCKKSVAIDCLSCEEIASAKTGIKPTYLFRLSDWLFLEKDLIKLAIEYQAQGNYIPINSAKIEQFTPMNLPKTDSIDGKDENGYVLKLARFQKDIKRLAPNEQRALRLFAKKPETTSSNAAQELKCSQTTAHKPLKKLYDLGILNRKPKVSSDKAGRSGYIYFLNDPLTPGLINAVFNQSQQESIFKSKPDSKDFTTSNGFVNHETLKDNKSDSMKKESSEQETKLQIESNGNLEVMAMVTEFLILRQQASMIAQKQKNIADSLRDIGGEQAEALITTLYSDNL
ncbi:hypothetical protein [Nostoc sp. C117]|uniref:hypothetical protein n=1 Tax=Nostoc sp. C117 TaxID=3349875 RepID=UPI00370D716B